MSGQEFLSFQEYTQEYGIYVITNVPSVYFLKVVVKTSFYQNSCVCFDSKLSYYLYNSLYINETSQDFPICENAPN